MKKYNLLILDDSIKTRKHSYEKLLDANFNFICHDDFMDLTIIDNPEIDGILLDMVLEFGETRNEKNSEFHKYVDNFLTVLKSIQRKKPVILVSRYFSDIASWISYTFDYNVEVIDFIGWSELFDMDGSIKDESLKNTISSRLLYSLNKYFKRTQSKKKPDESIFLLNISDLQYEDPDFDKSNKLASYGKIIDKLYEQGIEKIDLLVISGDISYSGRRSQFEKAFDWISNLMEILFKDIESRNERLIIVPGNHDVNLCVSASDYYEYDWERTDRKYLIQSKILNKDNFGLLPFSQFAYQITKDITWLKSNTDYNWINDAFINWGLRIIQLNTVSSLNYSQPSLFNIDESSIEQILKGLIPDKSKCFTVSIGHNSPENLGYSFTDKTQTDQRVVNLIEFLKRSKSDLYIHGHHHVYKPYKIKQLPNLRVLSTGTLNVKKNSDTSFTMIEFKRQNHKIQSCEPLCIKIN